MPDGAAPANVLEIADLAIRLPAGADRPHAVDGVDLTVAAGEILCLVGESGSGKSVIAQAVMGLLPPSLALARGAIRLAGEDLGAAAPARRRALRCTAMSMIFQEPMTALNPVMPCGRQIEEVLREHTRLDAAARRARVLEIMAQVRLPDPERLIDAYPHQLSGGQRQRIMIAMALVLEPALLIADEPTTALDVTTQAQILTLMRDLQEELGMAIIFITHDLGVIAQMVDFVVVMYLGRVVEMASVDTIFYNPQHPYTQSLLRSIPRLGRKSAQGVTSKLTAIRGSVPDPYSIPQGCPFHPRCRKAIKGVCDQKDPPFLQTEPGHQVRCVLYE